MAAFPFSARVATVFLNEGVVNKPLEEVTEGATTESGSGDESPNPKRL